MGDRILLNRIRTPDGTVLTSYFTHDYKVHGDTVSGEKYMVDGGCSYLRRSLNDVPFEDLTVYHTNNHEANREAFHWGTRGPKGDQPLTYKPLCTLDTDHIMAILDTQDHIPEWVRELFHDELAWRLLDEDSSN